MPMLVVGQVLTLKSKAYDVCKDRQVYRKMAVCYRACFRRSNVIMQNDENVSHTRNMDDLSRLTVSKA